MTRRPAWLLLAAALLCGAAASRPPLDLRRLPANTELIVPVQPGVKFGWVLPMDKRPATFPPVAGFDVDTQGKPWYAGRKRNLTSPLDNLAMQVNVEFHDFAWLEGSKLILASGQQLGTLVKAEETAKRAGPPMMRFVSLAPLPYPKMRLYEGAKGALYLSGFNTRNRRHEVFLIQNGKVEKLAEFKQAVNAVGGDGQATFVATGKLILKFTAGQAPERLFRHPNKTIQDVEYAPGTGLFYATKSSLGFIRGDRQAEFMKVQDPRIRLRQGTLYVLLGKTLEVIKIEGVAGFAKL